MNLLCTIIIMLIGKSFMKIINNKGPIMDPCGTLYFTSKPLKRYLLDKQIVLLKYESVKSTLTYIR